MVAHGNGKGGKSKTSLLGQGLGKGDQYVRNMMGHAAAKGGRGKNIQNQGKSRRNRRGLTTIPFMKKAEARRALRRGGCRRIGTSVYPALITLIEELVDKVCKHGLVFVHHARRKTLYGEDVVYALKHHGIKVFT